MTRRQATVTVSFLNLNLRCSSPIVTRIWGAIGGPLRLEADPAAPLADVIDRALERVRNDFVDYFQRNPADYQELQRLLEARLAFFRADAIVDARAVLAWLTEPTATQCLYRDSDGVERLMPFTLGHTSYRLGIHSVSNLVDFMKLAASSRTLSAVDAPDDHYPGGVSEHELPELYISIETHAGANALFDGANPPADPTAYGLFATWGPVAAGGSYVKNLFPSGLWESLNDDERWIFEDAATLVIGERLPTPRWQRASAAALTEWKNEGGWPRERLLQKLGLQRSGSDSSYFDPDTLVSDLEEVSRYRWRLLYTSIKRVLGLIEYRIQRSRPKCPPDCNNRRGRQGDDKRCKKVGYRWLGDAVRLKGSEYERALGKGGWDNRASTKVPAKLTMSELISAIGPHLPGQPCAFPLPTDDRSWARALDQIRDAVTGELGGVPVGALGQFLILLRNLCEHGAPATMSSVSLRPEADSDAMKHLGVSSVDEIIISHADLDTCLRLMVLLLEACRAKGILLFQRFTGFALTDDRGNPVTHSTFFEGSSIEVWLRAGTDVSALTARFSTTGSRVHIGRDEQRSGVTVNSFASPVIYALEGADGSTREFTVTAGVRDAG